MKALALAPILLLVVTGLAFAQEAEEGPRGRDGLAQRLDPTAARGAARPRTLPQTARPQEAAPVGSTSLPSPAKVLKAAEKRLVALMNEALGEEPEPDFTTVVEENTRGAYFRKVKSDEDAKNLGITGRARLPEVSIDADRWHRLAPGEDACKEGPLDRPSVYMGGNAAGHEVDCGLSWDRVYDASGHPESPARFAFRPFWRTKTGSETATVWHTPATSLEKVTAEKPGNVYFEPGERIVMTVATDPSAPDRVRMDIRSLDDPRKFFAHTFEQQGFGRGARQELKRINSVDQFYEAKDEAGALVRKGNEGKRADGSRVEVIPTRTTVRDGSWDSVSILGPGGASRPLAGPSAILVRGGDTANRADEVFHVRGRNPQGGETVTITPFVPARRPTGR